MGCASKATGLARHTIHAMVVFVHLLSISRWPFLVLLSWAKPPSQVIVGCPWICSWVDPVWEGESSCQDNVRPSPFPLPPGLQEEARISSMIPLLISISISMGISNGAPSRVGLPLCAIAISFVLRDRPALLVREGRLSEHDGE